MSDGSDLAATAAFSRSAGDALTVEAVLACCAVRGEGAACFGLGLTDAVDAIETVGALGSALAALGGRSCASTRTKALAIGVTGLTAIFAIGANAALADARDAGLGRIARASIKARTIGFARGGFGPVGANTSDRLVGGASSCGGANAVCKARRIGLAGLGSIFSVSANTSAALVGCARLGACASTSLKARTIGLAGLAAIFAVRADAALGCARGAGFFGLALGILADMIGGAVGVFCASCGGGFAGAVVTALTLRAVGVFCASCGFVFADTVVAELPDGTIAVLPAARGDVASTTDTALTGLTICIAVAGSRAGLARAVVADLAQVALAVLGAKGDDIALSVDAFLFARTIGVFCASRAFADKTGWEALGVVARSVAAISRRAESIEVTKLDAEIARPYEVTGHPCTAVLGGIAGLASVWQRGRRSRNATGLLASELRWAVGVLGALGLS